MLSMMLRAPPSVPSSRPSATVLSSKSGCVVLNVVFRLFFQEGQLLLVLVSFKTPCVTPFFSGFQPRQVTALSPFPLFSTCAGGFSVCDVFLFSPGFFIVVGSSFIVVGRFHLPKEMRSPSSAARSQGTLLVSVTLPQQPSR